MKVKKSRRIMRSLTIDEMSGVDLPAQEGARVVIMKRAKLTEPNNEELVEKLVILTSSDGGHQHAVRISGWEVEEGGGSTSYQSSGGEEEEGHSHDFIIEDDGSIILGDSNGHTHTVELSILDRVRAIFTEKGLKPDPEKEEGKKPSKTKPTEKSHMPMNEEEVQALIDKALKSQGDSHAQELEKAQAIGGLTDAQKGHYAKLSDGDQVTFLKLSSKERQSVIDTAIAKALDADPVVYTSDDGTEYRKSRDSDVVKMAKERDEDRREINKLRNDSLTQSLEKRAGELTYLPGTTEAKVVMLKAIDAIPNEELRKQALESMAAQNDQLATAFKTAGVRPGSVPISKSVEDELDGLVQDYVKAHGVDEPTAYGKVLDTARGAVLYSQSVSQ